MASCAIDNCIRELRARADLTQEQLAERVGVTHQTINAIELGKYSPSLETAFRLAAALGAPLEQVFQFRG